MDVDLDCDGFTYDILKISSYEFFLFSYDHLK